MILNEKSAVTGIKLENDEIKRVDDFKYLGSKLKSTEVDFAHRKSLAWAAYWKLEAIWKSKHIPVKLKANIFDATVIAILLYGSETWIVSSEMKKKLNSFATKCYRMWLGIRPLDKITNEEIYKQLDQKSLVSKLQSRQLSWVGHTLRRANNEPAKIFIFYEPDTDLGSHKRGRKPTSFFNYICGLLFPKRLEVSIAEIEKLANDRKLWKKHVAECCKTAYD